MEGGIDLAVLLQLITALAQTADPEPGVAPPCPQRVETLRAAREAVELVDRELAGALLGQVMMAFACGEPATADEAAEYFLLEGAMASYGGDDAGLRDAFRAAGRISPALWLASLGPGMQEQFVEARALPSDTGTLQFEPPLDGYLVLVDGKPAADGATLDDGLHLVQLQAGGQVVYATVALVPVQGIHVIEHELPPWRPEVTHVETGPTGPEVREGFVLHLAVGGAWALGEPLEGALSTGLREEPGGRLAVPLELGGQVYGAGAFARAAIGAAPLLNGDVLYGDATGPRASRASFGGHVAAGGRAGPLDIGVLTGPSWPGRWQVRGLVALDAPGPLQVELRAGANATTQRSPEPGVELMVVLQPEI